MTPLPAFSRERVTVAGCPIDGLDMDGAVRRCSELLASLGPHQVITANPLMVLAAEKSPVLREAFQKASLVVPDGIGLVLSALRRGIKLQRVPGIELMDRLCALAAAQGLKVFLLGAAPGVAEKAAAALLARHPGLLPIQTRHGYFQDSAGGEREVIDAVDRASPDFLFVALSTPGQEVWIRQNLSRLKSRIVMGVGGSFDVLSGRLRRSPVWMRSIGLEWFFRLAQEPYRLRKVVSIPALFFRGLSK